MIQMTGSATSLPGVTLLEVATRIAPASPHLAAMRHHLNGLAARL
jgi:hypothetical protein